MIKERKTEASVWIGVDGDISKHAEGIKIFTLIRSVKLKVKLLTKFLACSLLVTES